MITQTFADNDVFSGDAWLWLKERYDYTCLRCKRREPAIKLVNDHVVPKSKHGPNIVGNIQPLCKSCNSWKGNKAIDYRPDRPPIAPIENSGVVIPDGTHITYQYQHRKCGKPNCNTCNGDQAQGHGPYWYAYWREAGKQLSCYVGMRKELPLTQSKMPDATQQHLFSI